MFQKFVRFVLGRFSVVARDGHLYVGRDQRPFQGGCFFERFVGHHAGVGAFLLGDGDGDGFRLRGGIACQTFFRRCGPQPHEDIVGRLGRSVGHGRHIPQVNGTAVCDMHDQIAHLLGGCQKTARLDNRLPIARWKRSGRNNDIGPGQALHDLQGRQVIGAQALRVQRQAHLAFLAADHGKLRNVRVLLQFSAQLQGDAPKFVAVVPGRSAPQGQRQDGNIVDRFGFDHGPGDAGGIRSSLDMSLL